MSPKISLGIYGYFSLYFDFNNPISMDLRYMNLRSLSLCFSFNVLISRIFLYDLLLF